MPGIDSRLSTRWLPLAAALVLAPSLLVAKDAKEKLEPVKHIIVFYLENHSFDNLMGTFPGADGIDNAGEKTVQTDAENKPYAFLPQVTEYKIPDPRFPEQMPNRPFLITDYIPLNEKTSDLVHRFYQLQEQIDGGKMDHFALVSDAGGLTMGYYGEKDLPLWDYAKRYTLADRFFTGALGGSMLNHFWLICACTPKYTIGALGSPEVDSNGNVTGGVYNGAVEPAILRATLDTQGHLLSDGPLTPDNYAVNTIEPFYPPYAAKATDVTRRLPPVYRPTIGDRLSEKHIGWAWYSGGWANADAGHPDSSFIFHHQPFVYFANYAPGTKARTEHLKDESDMVTAIEKGTLPAVTFYKPIGENDLHPGYSRLKDAEDHVFALVRKIETSPLFKDSVIIVTFDDAGGWWDHVPPPKADRFGPGERVPTLIISPFAKKGFIDHTPYDTTSILKLIEMKYDLKPLGTRDAAAGDLTNALE